MNDNPYLPPAYVDKPASHATTHRAVRLCVGISAILYASWLIPVVYVGRLEVVEQNKLPLAAMFFATLLGGLAVLCVRRDMTWFAALMVWLPVSLYPVSVIIYNAWNDRWEVLGVIFLSLLLSAILLSPIVFALTILRRENTRSWVTMS